MTASSGEEGYSAATTESVDALLLDLMLPGRDGLAAYLGRGVWAR